MESKPPSQRKCLVYLTPETCGMFELGKIYFELGQNSHAFKTTACKVNRKDNLTAGLTLKTSFRIITCTAKE